MNRILRSGLLSLLAALAAAADPAGIPSLQPGAPLPPFALESCRGGPVAPHDLNDRIRVLVFTFAHCTLSCPTVSFFLDEADEILGRPPGLSWLLVTVNPAEDPPAERRLHLENLGLDPSDHRWDFLGGPSAEVEKVLEQYGIAVERRQTPDGAIIEHTPLLLIADRRGRIAYRQDDYALDPDSLATAITPLLGKEEAP
jgi:cytochrome oxidase Cu insertion factor (SCO1/SenC/PrrC family)